MTRFDNSKAMKEAMKLGHVNMPEEAPQKPHTVAAVMLGMPVSLATGDTEHWKKKLSCLRRRGANLEEDVRLHHGEDIGVEHGPCIMTLDVQGATAKPPYHVVMATRDVINIKG